MIKNVSWVFASKCVAMLAFLITDMCIARALGKTQYGEWAFFYAIITTAFYLCWFGIDQSSKVFVSKERELSKQKEVVNASLVCRILFSTVFAVVFFLIRKPVAEILGYPEKYENLFMLLSIGVIIVFGNSIVEYAKQLHMGLAKFKNFFVCNVLEFLAVMIFVVAGVIIKNDVISVAKGYALGYVVAAGVALVLILKSYMQRGVNFVICHSVFKYALPLALLGMGGLIMAEMDTFMLGIMSTSEQVAVYAIGKSLTSKVSQVNYSITCGTIQEFSNINANDFADKRKKFGKVVKVNLIVTSVICMGFILFSPLAIKIIYGSQYEETASIIWALLPYYFCLSISNLYSNFLDFQRKAKQRLACYVGTIVINLVLNYCMIPMYGAYGAAIASGIALIPYTILLIVLSNRVFEQLRKQFGEMNEIKV